MPKASPRVLIGRFYHESNRMNPQPAVESQFEIHRGTRMLEEASGSTLAGIIERLRERQVAVLPSVSVSAPPSGLIDHDFYERMKAELIDTIIALKPEAIALDLHGAMATTETADADGDLLVAVRKVVGPTVPIGIGLDLHAHLTDAMLRNSDVCIACKENPHSDVVQCGSKVADLMLEVVAGKLKPVTACARVPMILPGAGETATGPLAAIHQRARGHIIAHPGIKDISIYNVFRYADDYCIGQVITVTTDGPDGSARGIARELAGEFWKLREEFKDELLPIDEALKLAETRPSGRPYILADMGDRILAGAPGDSVVLLSAVLDHFPSLRGALTITDPDSALAAARAGTGAMVTLDVGGRITPGFSPRRITGEVLHVSDGSFTLAGPFHGGEASSLGTAAVVRVGGRISVLLTSKPAFSHDPAVFTSQGISLAEQDFVVVKSGYHFTMNFAGLGTHVLVHTPGVGYYRKGMFQYNKARFWPEHEVTAADITEASYTSTAGSC